MKDYQIVAKPHVLVKREPKDGVFPAIRRVHDERVAKLRPVLRGASLPATLFAIRQVTSRLGAEVVFRAEQLERNRIPVLAEAARRIDELGEADP